MKAKGLTLEIEIPQKDLERLMEDSGLMTPVEAGFSAIYATNVEYGRLPGTYPPLAPLLIWSRRKLNLSNEEAVEAAHAIQRKIYKHGIAPNPYFRPATEKVRSQLSTIDISKEGMYAISNRIISESMKLIEDKGITDSGNLINSAYSRRKP